MPEHADVTILLYFFVFYLSLDSQRSKRKSENNPERYPTP